jgi:hypothetical protein
MRYLTILACLLPAASGCVSHPSQRIYTVQEIAQKPAAFDGKRIRVRGFLGSSVIRPMNENSKTCSDRPLLTYAANDSTFAPVRDQWDSYIDRLVVVEGIFEDSVRPFSELDDIDNIAVGPLHDVVIVERLLDKCDHE